MANFEVFGKYVTRYTDDLCGVFLTWHGSHISLSNGILWFKTVFVCMASYEAEFS